MYVRQAATVDASQSTATSGALSFAWSLVTVPPGSAVTAGSLVGVSSSSVTFAPDVHGEYVLQVTVRAAGGESTARPKVEAFLPEVFFASGVAGDGGAPPSASYSLADTSGASVRSVLCPGAYDDAAAPMPQVAAYGGRAFDYWEGAAGQPSRFAAFTLDSAPDGGLTTHLWAGTSDATCGAPPVDLGTAAFGPGRPFGSEPHFNPSGTRFVVYDRQWRIVTYPADGAGGAAAGQVIAVYPVPFGQARSALDSSGLDPSTGYVFEPPRVEWTDSGLAWAQPTASGWEIVTAPDSPDAGTPTTYMTCKGITPREIAMLDDGTVIASYRLTLQSSENLYHLKPNAQQSCSREQQYTALSDSPGATAADFAVSPDGTEVAFLQIDPGSQDASAWMQGSSQFPGGYVYVVPVAGGAPRQISNDPALYGPRWIGSGTALAFTRLDSAAAGPSRLATSVVVIAPDGGGEQVIAQGDGVNTFVSTSGNAACSVGDEGAPGGAGRGALAWFGMAVGAFAVDRVRRRRARREAYGS